MPEFETRLSLEDLLFQIQRLEGEGKAVSNFKQKIEKILFQRIEDDVDQERKIKPTRFQANHERLKSIGEQIEEARKLGSFTEEEMGKIKRIAYEHYLWRKEHNRENNAKDDWKSAEFEVLLERKKI